MEKPPEAQVTCDLCNQTIDTTKPFAQLLYPFTWKQRQELAAATLDMVAAFVGDTVRQLGPGFMPAPRYHRFDFCKGCVDGFLPMMDDLKKAAFEHELDRLVKRATKKVEEAAEEEEG